jgi:hypothetical protein
LSKFIEHLPTASDFGVSINNKNIMANIRFYRRIPIIPGILYLNLSKSGISVSIGKKGVSVTFGKRGIRLNAGIPGTGLSINENINNIKAKKSSHNSKDHNINDFMR